MRSFADRTRRPRSCLREPHLRRGIAVLASCLLTLSAAAATVGPEPAQATPSAATTSARIAGLPADCRAQVSVVRRDATLAVGTVEGRKAQLHSLGVKLPFIPTKLAYLGSSSSRGLVIDRYYVADSTGVLHLVTVFDRPANKPAVTMTTTRVGTGWNSIRAMVSTGPYLYATTARGALNRYRVNKDYTVSNAGTLARSGWGGITSLSLGGWWDLGRGRVAEDIVGVSDRGVVSAYTVPRTAPLRVTSQRLTQNWTMFSHVAVGECERSNARPVVGVKPNGDVHVYLDANGNDQSWRDLRTGPRVARGWTGLVAD